jgi:hypothetical protein
LKTALASPSLDDFQRMYIFDRELSKMSKAFDGHTLIFDADMSRKTAEAYFDVDWDLEAAVT